MLNTITHIKVNYNDTEQLVPVRIKTLYGSVTKVGSLTAYIGKYTTTDTDDFDYSDEYKELDEC